MVCRIMIYYKSFIIGVPRLGQYRMIAYFKYFEEAWFDFIVLFRMKWAYPFIYVVVICSSIIHVQTSPFFPLSLLDSLDPQIEILLDNQFISDLNNAASIPILNESHEVVTSPTGVKLKVFISDTLWRGEDSVVLNMARAQSGVLKKVIKS